MIFFLKKSIFLKTKSGCRSYITTSIHYFSRHHSQHSRSSKANQIKSQTWNVFFSCSSSTATRDIKKRTFCEWWKKITEKQKNAIWISNNWSTPFSIRVCSCFTASWFPPPISSSALSTENSESQTKVSERFARNIYKPQILF